MYTTLQAQIEHVMGQTRFLSLTNLWRLCNKDCTTEEQRTARMEQLAYHIKYLRNIKPVLMQVPDYRTILQLHAAKRDIDAISAVSGANSHTILQFLEVAKAQKFTWDDAQDMTNGEIESKLFPPNNIILKTRSQLPFDKETRRILSVSNTVMCAMSRIEQLETILYLEPPTMLMWLSRIHNSDGTYEEKTFDVTVVDENNINATSMMLPVTRKIRNGDPQNDTTIHIAVVPNSKKNNDKADTEFLARAQQCLPPFDIYVIVTPEGNVVPVSRRVQ